jgi:hypothetical protein
MNSDNIIDLSPASSQRVITIVLYVLVLRLYSRICALIILILLIFIVPSM